MFSPRTADRVHKHWNYQAQTCELVILISRVSGRVFVSAPWWRLDELAREADDVELAALAERFGVDELRTADSRQRLVSDPSGATGKVSFLRKLLGRGPGR